MRPAWRRAQEQGPEERPQVLRVKRVEDAAHLVIAGDGSVNAIDAAQIALFGAGLLCEVEQRGTLEREHGEGAFQDIGQRVAGIAGPMIVDRLKLAVEEAHELVKVEILLQLLVTFSHSARLH